MLKNIKPKSKKFVCILWNRFGPYHRARFNAVKRLLPVIGIEFSRLDLTYRWGKISTSKNDPIITLFSDKDSQALQAKEIKKKISAVFSNIKPYVLFIPGWSDKTALAAFKWCLNQDVPTVVMSPSQALDAPRHWYKEWIKRRIVRLYSAGLAGGMPQKRYLESLGIPTERILTGYNVVDNEHFEAGAREMRKASAKFRKRLQLPKKYFVSSVRFVPKKNLEMLLKAYASYCRSGLKEIWDMVILGDGPLRSRLKTLVKQLGLNGKVLMPGFIQYKELPNYYGLAQALVLPSISEQWGLVVNEAMASGLPVIVSNRCGCVEDLVREGENGFVFDPFQEESITQAMIRITRAGKQLSKMGKHSQQIIKAWSPETFAKQVWKLTKMAASVKPPQAGFLDRLILGYISRQTMAGYQDQ